jgi:hypothetical protein
MSFPVIYSRVCEEIPLIGGSAVVLRQYPGGAQGKSEGIRFKSLEADH